MTRRWFALGLVGAAVLAACRGFQVGSSAGCAEACATAAYCGFLPSALGWGAGEDDAAAVADCERRCAGSPRGEQEIDEILLCLNEPESELSSPTYWCVDPESPDYHRWQSCAESHACLDDLLPGDALLGVADLTITLLDFDEYERSFGAVADLYARPEETTVHACDASLCAAEECAGAGGEHPCDDRLCGVDYLSIGNTCDTMKIDTLSVITRQHEKSLASMVLFDAADASGEPCGRAGGEAAPAQNARLVPGPIALDVRMTGRLPPAQLQRIGQPSEPPLDDPTGDAAYCLLLRGPRLLLRAGQNDAVIPIGDVADLERRGILPSSCL